MIASLMFLALSVQAQTPRSNGKPTERVVIQYEKLVAKGAFLTPGGWKKAGNLYSELGVFPRNGKISLMSTGGAVGEISMRGDKAEVETKWTDFFGTIDSALRYEAPKTDVPVTMTVYVFRLVYTNKHRETGKNGEITREESGPWEWKIEQPQITRWATVNRAIEYVRMMRDKTGDPLIKQNANKTLAALKRLEHASGQ